MVEWLGTNREGLRNELKSLGTEANCLSSDLREEEYAGEVA
jgi:hypothetical protein